MNRKELNPERKQYLNRIKREKFLVLLTQISLIIIFLAIWEWLAEQKIIDSFITSQPSRIFKTLLNLNSNNLWEHIWVTSYETLMGFILGTLLGIVIAIILWWSNFLSKVSEPFLVVLNSLPKVALRTNYYYLGRCWYFCNYCHGSCHLSNCYHFRKFKWFFKNR